MPLLFAYGTLQREDVQLSAFGRRLDGRPDALPGFERATVPIDDPQVAAALGVSHYQNVVPAQDASSRVEGTLFEITDAELAHVDSYERSAHYVRASAVLASGARCWMYRR